MKKRISNYAMLVVFSSSFIALNNCGQENYQEGVANAEETLSQEGPASDFAALRTPLYDVENPALPGPYMSVEISCNDGVDNDGDGLVDCMDNDCHIYPECSEFGPPRDELINSRATTVYPNGLLVNEDLAFLKPRGSDDENHHLFQRTSFFNTGYKDCWITPKYQDPYYNIPLGEAFIAGPQGAVGPQVDPGAINYSGPRAGFINECELASDLMTWHYDDDNGAGAGASGDTDDDEGGSEDNGESDD